MRSALLAGPFYKRVCIFGDPVPGRRPGSTRTPTLCEWEPTLLLVVIVGGVMLAAIVLATAWIVTRRRTVPMPAPLSRDTAASSQQPVVSGRDRSWRDVYARLLAFVDRSMADVVRVMPDDASMPATPMRTDSEESATLAAEVSVLGSSSVHAAHTAWSQALFRFHLLARDVADAWSQNFPEEQYEQDTKELRRTRSTVIGLAETLRTQIDRELRG